MSHKKYWAGFKKESLLSIIFIFSFFIYNLISLESTQIIIQNSLLVLIGFFVSYKIPKFLGNKIGGFNGDTCGASVVLVETIMLFMHAILL